MHGLYCTHHLQDIDTNHDGSISLAEFTAMMKQNGIVDSKEVR